MLYNVLLYIPDFKAKAYAVITWQIRTDVSAEFEDHSGHWHWGSLSSSYGGGSPTYSVGDRWVAGVRTEDP